MRRSSGRPRQHAFGCPAHLKRPRQTTWQQGLCQPRRVLCLWPARALHLCRAKRRHFHLFWWCSEPEPEHAAQAGWMTCPKLIYRWAGNVLFQQHCAQCAGSRPGEAGRGVEVSRREPAGPMARYGQQKRFGSCLFRRSTHRCYAHASRRGMTLPTGLTGA